MESVGQKLRGARTRVGLTLEQVSADTRITLKNLTAIEADDLSRINSPFFYRSFVRQYAAKVKLDYSAIAEAVQDAASTMPEPLVPGQEEQIPIQVSALKPRRTLNWNWLRSVASLCVMFVACSAVYAVWQKSHSDWHVLVAQVNAQLQNLNRVVRAQGQRVSSATAPRSIDIRPQRLQVGTAQSASAPQTSAPVNSVADDTLSKLPVESKFRVQLSAIERTWLSIVADGKQVFNGVLDPSQTKVLEGQESARVKTGNAGGVSVVFNGKEIGILGPRGEIRTVVFTRDKYQVLPSTPQVALSGLILSAE